MASLDDGDQPEPPALEAWEEVPWRAWNELNGERHYMPVGIAVPMGGTIIQARPGPIPWTAVQTWCDRARCTAEDREFVTPLVIALDREFLADWDRRQGKPPPTSIEDKIARWDAA